MSASHGSTELSSFGEKMTKPKSKRNQLDWLADGEFALYRLEHYFFIFIFYKSKIFVSYHKAAAAKHDTEEKE